jgi:hypothetical protein
MSWRGVRVRRQRVRQPAMAAGRRLVAQRTIVGLPILRPPTAH